MIILNSLGLDIVQANEYPQKCFLYRNQKKMSHKYNYGKCPKIWYTKHSDKMAYANSVDPDQTAPEGAV